MKCSFIKGLSVKLLVDGVQLQEYNDEDSIDGEEDTCTRFVEVTPDSTFRTYTHVESNFRYKLDDLLICVYLDGESVVGNLGYADPQKDNVVYDYKGAAVFRKGSWATQLFTFGSLGTSTYNRARGFLLTNVRHCKTNSLTLDS
jgi:hypothetical protein